MQKELFDKRPLKSNYERNIAELDFKTDKFILNLTPSQLEWFIEDLQYFRKYDSNPNRIWYGEIKKCPTCNKKRVTGCSACGCGSCFTCGYRWCCVPPTKFEFIIPTVLHQDGIIK